MALSTDTNKAQYSCNGSLTEFDLAVRILDEDDVQVFLKDTTTGAQTQLVKTTDYTIAAISGDYDNGARVTTLTTYSSDYQITLLREVDLTQDLDLEEGGDLPSDGLEDALDKGVMQAQQLDELLGRQITAPVTDASGLSYDIGTAEERASKVLGYDASGNVTQVALTETGTVGVDTNTGLEINSNVVSAKVDDSTIEFDSANNYKFTVKDSGVTATKMAAVLDLSSKTVTLPLSSVTKAMIENLSDYTVLGNVSGGAAAPAEVAIIDDDTMATATNANIPTAESIKAYVDQYAPNFVSDTKADTQTETGTENTWYQIGGLTPTVTAKRAGSTFKVDASISYGQANQTLGAGLKVMYSLNSGAYTDFNLQASPGNRIACHAANWSPDYGNGCNVVSFTVSADSIGHSAGDTVEFVVYIQSIEATSAIYINRSESDTDDSDNVRPISTLSVQEL